MCVDGFSIVEKKMMMVWISSKMRRLAFGAAAMSHETLNLSKDTLHVSWTGEVQT